MIFKIIITVCDFCKFWKFWWFDPFGPFDFRVLKFIFYVQYFSIEIAKIAVCWLYGKRWHRKSANRDNEVKSFYQIAGLFLQLKILFLCKLTTLRLSLNVFSCWIWLIKFFSLFSNAYKSTWKSHEQVRQRLSLSRKVEMMIAGLVSNK